jgi:hypothetical protein
MFERIDIAARESDQTIAVAAEIDNGARLARRLTDSRLCRRDQDSQRASFV